MSSLLPEQFRSRKWLAVATAALVAALALVLIGRWEGKRHAREELAGLRTVLAAIGPLDQESLDAYRRGVGPGLDCLLYKRDANPYALEICVDGEGRVVEGYDRRGGSPKIWSIREDPSASTIRVDRARVTALIDRLAQ
jgi:hypothetical protein